MAFIHRTAQIADRGTDFVFALFALATSYFWYRVLTTGQDPGVLAEALAWTVLAVIVWAVSAGVSRLRARAT